MLNRSVPGVAFGFTQPIEMRVDELVAGVKADVAASLYGDDLRSAWRKGEGDRARAARDSRRSRREGRLSGQYLYRHDPAAARSAGPVRHLTAQEVMGVVEALGGMSVGVVFEGRARVPVIVRLPQPVAGRSKPDRAIAGRSRGRQTRPAERGGGHSAQRNAARGRTRANRRRTFISANCRGRDVASFVAEAQTAVAEQVALPPGYELRWGGDFENLQSASRRLLLITPIVLLLIFLLLIQVFNRRAWPC